MARIRVEVATPRRRYHQGIWVNGVSTTVTWRASGPVWRQTGEDEAGATLTLLRPDPTPAPDPKPSELRDSPVTPEDSACSDPDLTPRAVDSACAGRLCHAGA